MNKKCYCSECLYVGNSISLNSIGYSEPHVECEHDSNVVIVNEIDNFFEKKTIFRKKRTANELNENNDCKYFKEAIHG